MLYFNGKTFAHKMRILEAFSAFQNLQIKAVAIAKKSVLNRKLKLLLKQFSAIAIKLIWHHLCQYQLKHLRTRLEE
jgi:hypothetical protein